jgi:hypothetical protein
LIGWEKSRIYHGLEDFTDGEYLRDSGFRWGYGWIVKRRSIRRLRDFADYLDWMGKITDLSQIGGLHGWNTEYRAQIYTQIEGFRRWAQAP